MYEAKFMFRNTIMHRSQNILVQQILGLLSLLCLFIASTNLYAETDLPNGLYHYTQDDLVVKVMGGTVKAQHDWQEEGWSFTRSWNDIRVQNNLASYAAVKITVSGSGGTSGTSQSKSITDNSNADNYYIKKYIFRDKSAYQATMYDMKRLPTSTNGGTYTATVKYYFDRRYMFTYTDTGTYTESSSKYTYTSSSTPDTEMYRWTNLKGDWAIYRKDGKLARYGDRNNVQVSFQYDANGLRTGVFDTFVNQVLWYEYDSNNHPISVRDQADATQARIVHYNWTNGKLTSVTDALGKNWTYEYGIGLSKVTDPDGRPTIIRQGMGSYQGHLKVISVTKSDGTGVFYSYHYDKTSKQFNTTVKYSSGKEVSTWYNEDGRGLRKDVNGVTVENVSINGRVYVSTDDLGQITTRTYDEWDNLIKITYPDNSSKSWTYDLSNSNILTATDEIGTVTKYDYDANGNLITLTEALGLSEQRITHFTYDNFGNLLSVRREADANTKESLTSYTYDNYGNRKSKSVRINATETDVSYYDSYDRMGNLLKAHDARSEIWQTNYDAKGQMLSIIDPLNHSTSFTYDGYGNITDTTNQLNYQRHFTFDINNRLVKYTDKEGHDYIYEYNNRGLQSAILDPLNRVLAAKTYDAFGRIMQVTDSNGTVTSVDYDADPVSNVPYGKPSFINYPTLSVKLSYNKRGRPIKFVKNYNNKSSIEELSYDSRGNLKELTDGELSTKRYAYDALNRILSIEKNDGSVFGFEYNNRDKVLKVSNENNIAIRRYVYDQKDRIIQVNFPSSASYQFAYDQNDNVIQQTDAKGQISEFIYDPVNRNTKIRYYLNQAAFANAQPDKTVTYGFDEINREASYSDGLTSSSYTYNKLDQLLTESVNYPNNITFDQTYTYDINGKENSYTGPDGITYSYGYDNNNRLTSINIPGEGQITLGNYVWKRPGQIIFPGGSKQTFDFEDESEVTHYKATDPANNVLLNTTLVRDRVGDIISKQTDQDNIVYGYDLVKRLTDVTYSTRPAKYYAYSVTGNRITDDSSTGQIQYNDLNQLTKYGSASFVYDANGSMTSKSDNNVLQRQYIYNLENRLSEVKDANNNTIASYHYDPYGRRLWKDVGGIRTYFVYNKSGIVAELDASGNVTRSYGFLPGSSLGTGPVFTRTSNGYGYYLVDQLATPQMVIDKNGAILWKGGQQPFGNTAELVGAGSNNLRFPGQYYDAETGLHYNIGRYYDPSTGRYISSDPTGIYGGLNTYAYAKSSPLVYADNTGSIAFWDNVVTAVLGAAIGGACSYISCLMSDKPTNCGCKAGVGALTGAVEGFAQGAASFAIGVVGDQLEGLCDGLPDCHEIPKNIAESIPKVAASKGADKITSYPFEQMEEYHRDTANTIEYRSHSGYPKHPELVDAHKAAAGVNKVTGKAVGGIFGCMAGFFEQFAMTKLLDYLNPADRTNHAH